MDISKLRAQYKLIDLFLELCEIPSPPLKETAVAQKIMFILKKSGISAEYDAYKNIIARIPGSKKYKNIQPLLLSAHMDVVGGSEEIKPRLSSDKKYIETDKTRTLGADDKAGVAAILDLAIDLESTENEIEHGPIEIIFTRDEEKGMTGMRCLDTSLLNSKYAVIADGESLGELDCEGAGFTNIYIKIYKGRGGHSGINIHEKDRISAIKVLSELDSKIPQGVYKFDPTKGVITSINAGVCAGGSIDTCISEVFKEIHNLGRENELIPKEYSSSQVMDTVNQSAALNVIASSAQIAYSIRSSQPENEKEIVNLIKETVDNLNKKYQDLIKIKLEVKPHLPPFERNNDDFLAKAIMKAGQKYNINCSPSSFHAGAETHILANEKRNSRGEHFNPVIIGIADLEDIHSPDEKINWESFLSGRKLLEQIVVQFAEDSVL